MKKKVNEIKIAYTIQKCFDQSKGVSKSAIKSLKPLQILLTELSKTASKQTHYDGLNEWSETVFSYLHTMLGKYGFINGGVAMGLEQPVDANFWWNIYDIVGSCIYSPNLETDVAIHHASAFERNQSLIKDIEQLQKLINKRTEQYEEQYEERYDDCSQQMIDSGR